MNPILYAICVLILVLPTACNESNSKSETKKKSTQSAADQELIQTEEFALSGSESVKGLVDMIWVIDNSGSMTEEAALVRKNLENFLSNLNQYLNVKLALLSLKGSSQGLFGNAVELSAAALSAGNIQLNISVQSTNGPSLVIEKHSQLASFLRADAERVYVFVTDDNSAMSAADFLKKSTELNNGKQPKIFSFIGKGSCRDKLGTVYEQLATATGAQTFDVCEADWSAHFASLTAAVEKLVPPKRDFTLKFANIVKINSIELDGKALDVAKFRIENQKLICSDPTLLPDAAQKLLIKYQYNP